MTDLKKELQDAESRLNLLKVELERTVGVITFIKYLIEKENKEEIPEEVKA